MRKIILQVFSIVTMFLVAATANASVNVQLIPSANKCKGAVIYNNSSHVLEVTVSYIYEGQGGSYHSGSTIPITVQPRSNWTHSWLYEGPVDCSKPYNVRTNYTYIDKTVEAGRAADAQRRQADAERGRQDQFLRDQKRRNDEAEAARKKRNEEFLRQREAKLKKEREDRARMAERGKNPHWDRGCPPGQHCKPLHFPSPSNPNQDTSARVHVTCLGLVRTSERDLRECRQIEAKIRLADEERQASEAVAAAEDRRRREAEESARARQEEQSRVTEQLDRQQQTDPCGAAEAWRRRGPQAHVNEAQPLPMRPLTPVPPNASAELRAKIEAENKWPSEYNARAQLENERRKKFYENHKAAILAQFEQSLVPLDAKCASFRNRASASPTPSYPNQNVAPTAPYAAPSPAAQVAQTTDPCENLRKALENDKKNLLLAYQLRRCVKKNRQAIQVQ